MTRVMSRSCWHSHIVKAIQSVTARGGTFITPVTMPKTAVHENNGVKFRNNNVRTPRKLRHVHEDSISRGAERMLNRQLQPRASDPDTCHNTATGLRVNDVGHQPVPALLVAWIRETQMPVSAESRLGTPS